MAPDPYYQRHIFFCLNQRDNGEACCADHDAQGGLRPLQVAGQGGEAWPGRARCASTRRAAWTAAPAGRSRWSIPRPSGTPMSTQRHRRDRRFAPEERPGRRAPAAAARRRPLSRSRDERRARVRAAASPARPARIECAIDRAGGRAARLAVVCHPHPQFGGTMDNKVVQTLARAFAAARLAQRALQLPRRRRARRAPGTKAAARSTTRWPWSPRCAAAQRVRRPAAACWPAFRSAATSPPRPSRRLRRRRQAARGWCWSARRPRSRRCRPCPPTPLVDPRRDRRRRAARGDARLGAAADRCR